MTLSQLIATIGDVNVNFQNLGQSGLALVTKGKKDARVTFHTSIENGDSLMRQACGIPGNLTCFVVWIPTDKMEAAIAADAEKPKERE